MTAYRDDADDGLSNINHYRRQMEASMLEYSQRMRKLNHSRGDPYRFNGRFRDRDPHYPGTSRGSMDTKATIKYPRHKRPLSFDEKELQRNKSTQQLSKQRAKRDTKSERSPTMSKPHHLPPSGDLPVLPSYGPSTTDLEVADRQRKIRINLVNTADLYDLVDLRLQENNPIRGDVTAKVANPAEIVRVVEDMHWARPRKKPSQLDPLYSKSVDSLDGNRLSSPSFHEPSFLIGRSIKNQFVNPKQSSKRTAKPAPRHEDIYVLDKDYQKGRVVYQNQPSTSANSKQQSPPNERVIDVFLEQAVSGGPLARSLKQRPKRAKRMQLHKPDLLSIPEDSGSFAKPHGDTFDSDRKDAVPYPTSSSLTAIKDLGGRHKHETTYHRGEHGDEHVHTSHRLSDSSNSNSFLSKSPRKPKSIRDMETRTPRGKVDLDSVIMTSIYSGLPIMEPDIDRNLRLRHVTLDKPSHKERASKKMKRLIFLRDQPEQSLKRDF